MTNKKFGNPSSVWICLISASCLCLYVFSYFVNSKIFHGMVDGKPLKIRVFKHPIDTKIWFPLLEIEKLLTPQEFYWQVRSGASLPPADSNYYPSNEMASPVSR